MEAQSAVSAPLREWMTRRGLEEFIGAARRVRLLEVSDLGFVDPETVEEMGRRPLAFSVALLARRPGARSS